MSNLLIEYHDFTPSQFHYAFNRGGNSDTDLQGAVEYLQSNGCTHIIHAPAMSFGIVEPCSVYQQRARMPQYG